MLGCYGVKFRYGWNWLKIEIWDLQALYSNAMYLVFLDPVSPYPKIVQRNRVVGAVPRCKFTSGSGARFWQIQKEEEAGKVRAGAGWVECG